MSDYKKDIDTIIWSLPFKRLGGKTQVFGKGLQDHHRDRLTHTIEVMNLSEKLASEINKKKKRKDTININLCKAIALAHDLGHTPFGHAGEKALDFALSKIVISDCDHLKGLNGFNHYEQGVDAVSYIYSKDTTNNGKGLFVDRDVRKEICNGILLHRFEDLNQLIENTKYSDIITNDPQKLSSEAKTVRICDKIAYFISDLEDGFIVNAISISDLKSIDTDDLFRSLRKAPYDLSEHRSFLRCRNKIMSKLIGDCAGNRSIDADKFKNLMKYVLENVQKGIICKNYYVKNSDEKGKLIVSCLFCQYLRNPELIGSQSFRYKYHNHAGSYLTIGVADTVSYYKRIRKLYNILDTSDVEVRLCEWFEENKCSDSNIEQVFKRNIVDVICVKDWVASLTDRYAEKCYHEHVNCWKSKEKWNRLNNIVK